MGPNLFADIGSASSLTRPEATEPAHSPLEIHSDAMDADDLPMQNARTPLRSLPSLGPMDVFVGSSPTPQARTRTQEVPSDQTSVATPTAVRTVRLGDDAELDSSPPHFEKDVEVNAKGLYSNEPSEDLVSDSFASHQPRRSLSFSFDDGTTFDDAMLPQADSTIEDAVEDVCAAEIDASDMPSSTIDLQLIAQIDADMQSQMDAGFNKQSGDPLQKPKTNSVAADLAKIAIDEAGLDTPNEDAQVEDTQLEMSTQVDEPTPDAGTSSTSRIGDSFSSQAAELESPQVRSLRSSQRMSATSSPSQPTSATKRKSSGRGRGRPKRNKTEEAEVEEAEASPTPSKIVPDSDGMLDNIVVASPRTKPTARRAGKVSLAPRESEVVVPETSRKRALRRSASLLSQVETQSDHAVIEDTPAPKRARLSGSQDVSGAKASSQGLQAVVSARLSHVRVTPRRSDIGSTTRGSLAAVDGVTTQATTKPVEEKLTAGEQVAEVALQLPNDLGAAGVPQQSQASVSTPSRSFAERVILTPRSIINQLRNLKDALFRSSQLVLGRQEERDIDDALFELRREVHEAGRRAE